jgi:hypothetical protein
MQRENFKEELAVRYLLGDLTDDEQVEVEDRAFADHQYMERMLAVEDDLIDNYLRGSLSQLQRDQFEKRFLTSEQRRQKIEFARALAEVSSRSVPASQQVTSSSSSSSWEAFIGLLRNLSPVVKFSLATASLVGVIGVGWLIGQTITLRRELKRPSQEQAVNEPSRPAEPQPEPKQPAQAQPAQPQPAPPPAPPAAPPTLATLVLFPGISRSASDLPRLVIPQTSHLTRLEVGLERTDDYRNFGVEVRSSQGRVVWRRDRLQPQQSQAGRIINLLVPGSVFRTGQYELALKGSTDDQKTEDVRFYYFDVRKP